jgi:hypothetical protein
MLIKAGKRRYTSEISLDQRPNTPYEKEITLP